MPSISLYFCLWPVAEFDCIHMLLSNLQMSPESFPGTLLDTLYLKDKHRVLGFTVSSSVQQMLKVQSKQNTSKCSFHFS